MRKEEFLCTVPFGYSEVFQDKHYLCCPGWLPESVYETGNMKTDFFSDKSNEIRESIIDGSYKYCSETQCPHLSNIKQGKQIDGRFLPKTDHNIQTLRNKNTFNNIDIVKVNYGNNVNKQYSRELYQYQKKLMVDLQAIIAPYI